MRNNQNTASWSGSSTPIFLQLRNSPWSHHTRANLQSFAVCRSTIRCNHVPLALLDKMFFMRWPRNGFVWSQRIDAGTRIIVNGTTFSFHYRYCKSCPRFSMADTRYLVATDIFIPQSAGPLIKLCARVPPCEHYQRSNAFRSTIVLFNDNISAEIEATRPAGGPVKKVTRGEL